MGDGLYQRVGDHRALSSALGEHCGQSDGSATSMARLIPVVVAVYYALAVIPTFLFLRERSVKVTLPPGENYVSVGFRQLKTTFAHIRQYRDLFRLLIAFLIYNDGIVTVIYFAGLYAKNTLQFTPSISA